MRGLLTALGLDQDAVASYSLERLEEFCSAKTITVHSAYLRTEEDGTVSYHTREEALAELTADRERAVRDAWMNLRVGWTSGSKEPEGDLFTVNCPMAHPTRSGLGGRDRHRCEGVHRGRFDPARMVSLRRGE